MNLGFKEVDIKMIGSYDFYRKGRFFPNKSTRIILYHSLKSTDYSILGPVPAYIEIQLPKLTLTLAGLTL